MNSNAIASNIISDLYRGIFSLRTLVLFRLKTRKMLPILPGLNLGVIDVCDLMKLYARKHLSRLSVLHNKSKEYFELVSRVGSDEDFAQIIESDQKWDHGLAGAAEGGHIDRVTRMIENGAEDYSIGFVRAARGGHIDILNLMLYRLEYQIEKSDLRCALNAATKNGHTDVVAHLNSLVDSNRLEVVAGPFDRCATQ